MANRRKYPKSLPPVLCAGHVENVWTSLSNLKSFSKGRATHGGYPTRVVVTLAKQVSKNKGSGRRRVWDNGRLYVMAFNVAIYLDAELTEMVLDEELLAELLS